MVGCGSAEAIECTIELGKVRGINSSWMFDGIDFGMECGNCMGIELVRELVRSALLMVCTVHMDVFAFFEHCDGVVDLGPWFWAGLELLTDLTIGGVNRTMGREC